jgi:hypothetical protein
MLDLEWSKNASYFSLECDKVDIMSKSYLGGLGLLPPSLNKEKKRRAFNQAASAVTKQAKINGTIIFFYIFYASTKANNNHVGRHSPRIHQGGEDGSAW